MPNKSQFKVEEIGLDSAYFEDVIKLYVASKSRLGLFPRGAFEDHACQKNILAAITPANEVAGYLLYRVAKSASKQRASITHLTTSERFRNKGVARLLTDHLKQKTRHLLGISLSCRRDYNISEVWQGFGFTVRHCKEGRGADGAILDYWWYGHQHDDLFSLAASREDTCERVLTAIDANVFFDLICDGRPHADDSRVLEADWLQGSIVLCVTKEIYNEIHRSRDEDEKKRGRIAAQRFREVKTDDAEIRALEIKLAPLFNGASIERDLSDMRQVAHAIAAEVPFLVTRDVPMLSRSDLIFEQFDLRILHPTELINRFDVLRRGAEYRPVRLEGSRWRERLVVAEDVETVVSLFKHKTKERSGNFDQQIRHYIVNPNEWISKIVVDGGKSPTIYIVHSNHNPARLEIPFLRHTDHPLAGTLLRHLIHELSREISSGCQKIISVTDSEISDETASALAELGFIPDSNAWWKISMKGIVTRDNIVAELRRTDKPLSIKERFVGANFVSGGLEDDLNVARLEHLFSPAKLVSSAMACYVVSIRPSWAAHFFDIPVGGQTLMDLNEKLHLGIEGAYYCGANNTHVKAPGRVLWYVSGKGSMCIKACSFLEERFIGTPKELYARFKHLGVYGWKHVLETVNGKLDHSLMTFKFSRTERFVQPIELATLLKLGVPQPQNPRKIRGDQFATLYKLGMNL